jgi:cellulose biosynthesis protein BcsQ
MSLKTLLVELDSDGEITRCFGVEQDRSLPVLAEDQSDPRTSIWATDSPDLHLLQFNSVGSLYGNELQAVGRAMNSVKSIYEVIIVDAPALAKEPYALRLAEWLDRVLVVSQADISRIELLKYKLRAMRLWPDVHTGIVLNGASNEGLML